MTDETSRPVPLDDAGVSTATLEAINARFESGSKRMGRIEEAMQTHASALQANTELTARNGKKLDDLHDVLELAAAGFVLLSKVGRFFARVGRFLAFLARLFRKAVVWLTPIAAAAGGIWHFFFRDGGKP